MLEELLKHNKLGNRDELLFFLFDGLSTSQDQTLENVRKYCTSKIFSISGCFDGIVKFFQFINFIEISKNNVTINSHYFNKSKFNKQSYLQKFHLYKCLFKSLKNAGVLNEIFNGNNLRYSPKLSQYYILENRFPYKYFPIRNLLLSIGFFHRQMNMQNIILVNKNFTNNFKSLIVEEIRNPSIYTKKITLEQLKKANLAKEDAGNLAELFALEFEHKRLHGHPELEMVKKISDEFANAGYDIESYDDINSIVFDRFIEVKSYNEKLIFYWSKNEIEMAKKLGDKYYLYLIDRSRISVNDYKPKQYQNPYKLIYQNNDVWMKETENWKFTLKNY